MKKTTLISGFLLFALVILLPFGVVLSSCFGYTFELTSYSLFAIITALLAVGTVVSCIAAKETVENRIVSVLFALLTPLSLVNAVCYIFACSRIWVVASMFVCVWGCCYLAIKPGKPLTLTIISLVLSALMVLPIGFFGFIALIFGNIGQNTVVQSVESPNGTYYAEVIDSNQGALGGDTLVDVYEDKGINALVFKISKKPQRVYHGDWGEFENMDIYWKNDNCLVINSVEYEIE